MAGGAQDDHVEYDRIEEELNAALAVSLGPRSPDDVLYSSLDPLGLAAGSVAVDVGCGAGRQSLELARRFGCSVRAFDPLLRYGDAATAATSARLDVVFEEGVAESVPLPSGTADLVLYREMLYLVDDLAAVFAEGRRLLTPQRGRIVVYQLFNTDWLEPRERERFWETPAEAANADVGHFEASATGAGLAVETMLDLGGETVEWAEEQSGKGGRELLAASRLLRNPDPYVAQFGQRATDIKLTDSFWFVYRLIGKLTQRLYVLRPT